MVDGGISAIVRQDRCAEDAYRSAFALEPQCQRHAAASREHSGAKLAVPERSRHELRVERRLWAEQRAENWWDAVVDAIRGVLAKAGVAGADVKGVGLSGQMHGLVILDSANQVIRPSLIWCDQRSQAQVDFVNSKVARD